MRIAFLNLCHTDPDLVARAARRLTADPDFDMFIHVDAKQDIEPFRQAVKDIPRVYFTEKREKVYWGGYNAITATYDLLRDALNSDRHYDYFVTMQNLDYPLKSNREIREFFEKNEGREFIRGCPIARTEDWEFARKYRLFYKKDNQYGKTTEKSLKRIMMRLYEMMMSLTTIGCDGVIREDDGEYPIYYGCAQWAVTRECAEYLDDFEKTHSKFNKKMRIMQFPDEEYFHTVVHNSKYRTHCLKYDEPEQRWLVNWRNLHYFEFPKEVTTLTERDYERLKDKEELFIRKVRTGISDGLLNILDGENS
ncbi:Core-2/I-Branching enzyme [Lachnospiraceae bacterium]|nr:Core-2/I-Branching enzyme [Lachnospiraceae bacterium]